MAKALTDAGETVSEVGVIEKAPTERGRLRRRPRRHPMAKLKVGVLISGRGSNLAALIEAAKAADYPAEVGCVVSNKADAPGLAIAAAAGVPTAVVSHRDHPDRETFDRAVSAELERRGVELVVAGGLHAHLQPVVSHLAGRTG